MTYTCALCRGTFEIDADHDAVAEFKENFGREVRPDDEVICHDCWVEMPEELKRNQ